uniref:Uncharacterized protein n=1 Tax=Hyaloperonospora arabidopsidis (strain Emoy2) TaxID=559515 RepID=M4BQN9_HYAAE
MERLSTAARARVELQPFGPARPFFRIYRATSAQKTGIAPLHATVSKRHDLSHVSVKHEATPCLCGSWRFEVLADQIGCRLDVCRVRARGTTPHAGVEKRE